MNTDEIIIEIIRKFIEAHYEEDMTRSQKKLNLTSETAFVSGLGTGVNRVGYLEMDILELVEIIMIIEKETQITISDDATDKFATIGDVQKYIREHSGKTNVK